jgi:hypothetical protein
MEWMQAAMAEDVGNIVAMEHVNITVPDPVKASVFYLSGLGLTRDPYMMVGPENMWVNVGEQQFHLPSRSPAQVVPGHIGLVVTDLAALQERLKSVQAKLAGSQFAWSLEDGHVAVTCPWGNRFRCRAPSTEFGGMALGIPYVELLVRPGAAAGIARFYKQVLGAPAALGRGRDGVAARVPIGAHQALIFRETREETPPYDGHHVAVYMAQVSGPYRFLKERNLVMEELIRHQFRFKEIVDPKTGDRLVTLEHEVRSLLHPMYHRELVNRDPTQSIRSYQRGRDAAGAAVR